MKEAWLIAAERRACAGIPEQGPWRSWRCCIPWACPGAVEAHTLFSTPEACGREIASLRLGACSAGLAQLALLYALGVLGALCAYAGYAVFALLVQARP